MLTAPLDLILFNLFFFLKLQSNELMQKGAQRLFILEFPIVVHLLTVQTLMFLFNHAVHMIVIGFSFNIPVSLLQSMPLNWYRQTYTETLAHHLCGCRKQSGQCN